MLVPLHSEIRDVHRLAADVDYFFAKLNKLKQVFRARLQSNVVTQKMEYYMITHYIHKNFVATAIWTHASMGPFFFVNKLEYRSFLNADVIDRINMESILCR